MPQHSTTVFGYEAARRSAAFVDHTGIRGRLIVAGPDRAGYLQGLLTNDVASLAAGRGCYAAMLTPQGRMIADLTIYELGDVMLLSLARAAKDTVLARLDQFVFSENVQLGDVTDSFAEVAVVGPDSAAVLSALLDSTGAGALAALPEHGNLRASFEGRPAIVAHTSAYGVPGHDLFVDASLHVGVRAALAAHGIADASGEAAEALRVEAGVPLFGRDMDEETIPLEAGIESRAISFTKGCYVGQEVIVRVLHRGHGRVAKHFVGLMFDPSAPAPASGAVIDAGGRSIGRVTSAVVSPALGRPIALGYVHRDFASPGTAVAVDASDATVVEIPFVK